MRQYRAKKRAEKKAREVAPIVQVRVPAPSDPARVVAEWSASRLKVPTGPFPPHTRGCTVSQGGGQSCHPVSPAHAGICPVALSS